MLLNLVEVMVEYNFKLSEYEDYSKDILERDKETTGGDISLLIINGPFTAIISSILVSHRHILKQLQTKE